MYEIWSDRIRNSEVLRTCGRRQLKLLVAACLEHAFLGQYEYYQPQVEPSLLRTMRDVLLSLWAACRDNRDLHDTVEYERRLETGFTDDHEYTGPLVHGFETLLSGTVDALKYFVDSQANRDDAISAMGNAYYAVAQEAMQAYLGEHPLSGSFFEQYFTAQEIEYKSAKCLGEIEFQETSITAVVAGKCLVSQLEMSTIKGEDSEEREKNGS